MSGTFSASVDWAQRSDNGESWQKARDHYYLALTTGSEAEFATTFKALGQLMHLVSDLAVPAHVRNDPHPSGDLYEAWTSDRDNRNLLIYTGSTVDQAIFSQATTTGAAPAPITALWDHDVYNGTNPADTLTTGPMTVGLAEYTNANFFSQDTFTGYPSPAAGIGTLGNVDWDHPESVTAEDGKSDTRVYLYGNAGGPGPIKKAGASLISFDTLTKGANPPWQIDDNVSRDYASLLVPAAVGYSTALLDYFFRGDIDLKSAPSAGGYLLFNNSDEEMTGDFAVYYDNADGTRSKIPGAEWLDTTVAPKSRLPVAGFNLPEHRTDPAKYYLVFKGKIGNEDDAVAGRIVSLKPFGLLVIALSGELLAPTGDGAGNTGPTMYLAWDVGHDTPLVLGKTTGGFWQYPISATEYEGAWHEDLLLAYSGVSIESTSPLFTTEPVTSNIFSSDTPPNLPPTLYGAFSASGFYWSQSGDGSDGMDSPIEYFPYHPYGVCEDYLGPRCAPYDNAYVLADASITDEPAVNSHGWTDTWSRTIYDSLQDSDSRPRHSPRDQCDSESCQLFIENNGVIATTGSCHYSMSFRLPRGGNSTKGRVGWTGLHSDPASPYYVIDTTSFYEKCVLPYPFQGNALALVSQNHSGAPIELIGPEINYAATLSLSRNSTIIYTPSGPSRSHVEETSSVHQEVAASGTLTTITGLPLSIGLNFTENGSVGNYAGSRQSEYATDSLHVASGIDLTDNILALITIQSIATGSAESTILHPTTSYPYSTQAAPTYSSQDTSYYSRTICSAVVDADTQDPWELPNNPALTTELQSAIAHYVANNPPSGNNHWKITTSIYKIQ